MKIKITVIAAIIVMVMAVALLSSSCINQTSVNKNNNQPDPMYDKTDLGYLDDVMVDGIDNSKSEAATDLKNETEEKDNKLINDSSVDKDYEKPSASLEEKEPIEGEVPPGPDVALLVNLRGDETTAYKLVDGTYLDRIERKYIFNGTDTWTDEEGVEWNEKVN